MALTELQRPPSKGEFYRKIRTAASEMNILMFQWKELSEYIGLMDAGDLDDLGVATGQVRQDLASFRTLLNEFVTLYESGGTDVTGIPSDIVDLVRGM